MQCCEKDLDKDYLNDSQYHHIKIQFLNDDMFF